MKQSLAGVVLAVLATATNAQLPLNITGCTVPCNLGTTAADVLIFVDSSNGMGQANLDLVKSALIQWQSPYGVGPSGQSDQLRVAIIDYAVYATAHGLLVENHNDHAELVNLINDVKFRGYDNRNIYYALLEGLGNLNTNAGMRGPEVPKIGMIFSAAAFTDGSTASAQSVYKSYTNAGFVFYGIGIGRNANIAELSDFVGQNNVFQAINAEQLQYVVGWLLNKSCNPSPTPPAW
uniref:VWFA domain-containing protein n=1 Tax=Plectus sambesii TaxID=2011161 RepID=A0A914XIW2_9BILA